MPTLKANLMRGCLQRGQWGLQIFQDCSENGQLEKSYEMDRNFLVGLDFDSIADNLSISKLGERRWR